MWNIPETFFRDYNINITTIVPGYIATDKLKSLSKEDITNKPTVLSEEKSTDIIVKAINDKKEKVIYPLSMRILIAIITKLPKSFNLSYDKTSYLGRKDIRK